MVAGVIDIFEPSSDNSTALVAAQALDEQTLDPDERIPWEWIERSVGKPATPGGWVKHLVLAEREGQIVGYGYGAFVPGYGGYVCYLGVDEAARGRGVAGRLFAALFAAFRADATLLGETLPFVVWESYRPRPDEPQTVWAARLKSFARAGGLWVDGVELMSPDYADPAGEPVPLQLFVRPEDVPAAGFDSHRLRKVVAGLLERVYHETPGDELYERSLPPGCEPRLDERRGSSPPKVGEAKGLRLGQAPPLVAAS